MVVQGEVVVGISLKRFGGPVGGSDFRGDNPNLTLNRAMFLTSSSSRLQFIPLRRNTYSTSLYLYATLLLEWQQRSQSASVWQQRLSSYATSYPSTSVDDLTHCLGPRRTRSTEKIPRRRQRNGESILQRRIREDDEQKGSGLNIRGRVRYPPLRHQSRWHGTSDRSVC